MDFIYPKAYTQIFLPKDFNGKTNDVIFRLAHGTPETKIFWYLDKTFIGTTKNIHEMAIHPKKAGKHIVTVVDEFGNEVKRIFEITE
jgi:penicillin-binding protein 1C